jgi:sporulation protein YlmC with PRC-barrel domain
MPTPSGHTRAICASKVAGTAVYNLSGEKIGTVDDVVLDKMSNEIMFAIVAFGGFLGIGEKYHALPWAQLDYDENQGGYVVNLSRDVLEKAPIYEKSELMRDYGAIQTRAQSYYAPYM